MGGPVVMRVMVGIIWGQSCLALGHHAAPSSSTCTWTVCSGRREGRVRSSTSATSH